jgi:sugar phosphate isomerase/epimerase
MRLGVKAALNDAHVMAALDVDFLEVHLRRDDLPRHLPSLIETFGSIGRERDLGMVVHAPEFLGSLPAPGLVDPASPDPTRRDMSVAVLEATIDLAREIDAGLCVVHPGGILPQASDPSARGGIERLAGSLEQVRERARDHGIRVAVENMPWFYHVKEEGGVGTQRWESTLLVGWEDFGPIGESVDGLTLDISHGFLHSPEGGMGVIEGFITHHKDRILHLHLSDALPPDHEGLQIGEGAVDLPSVLSAFGRSDITAIPEIIGGHRREGLGFKRAMEELRAVSAHMVADALRARLRLLRVQTMALTGLVPVFGAAVFLGAVTDGEGVVVLEDLVVLVPLFLLGACFHIYGFVLNEWADVEVDRASVDLATKPLVSGTVSSREAIGVALGGALLCYLFLAMVTFEPLPYLMLTLGIFLGGAYDLWGKGRPLDVVLAGSLTALLVTGALATGSLDLGSSRHLALLGGLVALQFLQNLFENAIEGGLKDADHDLRAGARTMAVVMGTQVVEGHLMPSRGFVAAAVGMKVVHAGVLIGLVAFVVVPDDLYTTAIVGGTILMAIVVMAATMVRFLKKAPMDRPALKRLFSVHEMAAFMAAVAVFSSILGLWMAISLLALPVAWFITANALLYGRPLEPGV